MANRTQAFCQHHLTKALRAAEAAGPVLRGAKVQARRQLGNTQETERDEQWVVILPERLSEASYAALESFVALAAVCMGIESADE